jgi:hypothetical protein
MGERRKGMMRKGSGKSKKGMQKELNRVGQGEHEAGARWA